MKNKFFSLKGLLVVAAGALMLGTAGCDPKEPLALPSLTITYDGNELTGGLTRNDVPIEGDDISIVIKSTRNWTATVPTEAASWIEVDKTSGTSGTTSVEITVKPSTDEGKRGPVSVAFKTTDGQITKNVTITQNGTGTVDPDDEIYRETVGSGSTSGNPLVANYTGWETTGTGASTVTYSASSGSVSVRSSGTASAGTGTDGPYSAYSGASGVNSVFFGTNWPGFVVNNITLPAGETGFRLQFGAQRSVGAPGNYDNVFNIDDFIVLLSANGTDWSDPIEYTTAGTSTDYPYWVLATANFTLPSSTNSLYIKFATSEPSAYRLDDIVLIKGNGGQAITFDGAKVGGGGLMEIKDLVAAWYPHFGIAANTTIKGTVVSDAAGKNSYSHSINIVDGTGENSGMLVYGLEGTADANSDGLMDFVDHSFVVGDIVTVDIAGAKMATYNGLREITGVALTKVTKESSGTAYTAPVPVTSAADLNKYQSMLVSIECSPMAENIGQPWGGTANKTLKFDDDNGVEFDVFSRPADVSYASEIIPAGGGTLIGIVGYYNVAQLQPRNVADLSGMGAGAPSFVVGTPNPATVAAAGGDATVSVTTGSTVAWTATVLAGSGGTITSGATGTGNGTVTVTFPANTDTENGRSVVVNIETTDTSVTGDKSYTVPFAQAKASAPGGGMATFDFVAIGTANGWSSNTSLNATTGVFTVDGVSLTFDKGTHSTWPAWNGGVIRMYSTSAGLYNSLTITAPSGKNITDIAFTFGTTANANWEVDKGTLNANFTSWTGEENSIVILNKSRGSANDQRFVAKVEVTYE